MMRRQHKPSRIACSLCGQSDRTVTACDNGVICEPCADRVREGRDSTTLTVRALQSHLRKQADAQRMDVQGNEVGEASEYRMAAAGLLQEELAQPVHHAVLGAGQEVVPQDQPWLRETMARPNVVAMDASSVRVDLLAQGGVEAVALGLDMAETLGARNSLERALAHQLAALHKTAMETLSRSGLEPDPLQRVRLLNSANRLMTTYQAGMLTWKRFRASANQDVLVQHINVAGGGQAVVGDVHHHRDLPDF